VINGSRPHSGAALRELYAAAVAGALPADATRAAVAALALSPATPVHVIGIGKAAREMANGALSALDAAGVRVAGGVLVSPGPVPTGGPPRIPMVIGDHPVPREQSEQAARAIGDAVARINATDQVIVLISGGGSSLAAAPAPEAGPMTQADVGALYEALLESGADIDLVNAVRKRFTRWSGGRLAAALAPAAVHCLIVSDVPGDDPGTVSSGPCAPDPVTAQTLVARLRSVWSRLPEFAQTHLMAASRGDAPETLKPGAAAFAHVDTQIVASNRQALAAAATRASTMGFDEVSIEAQPLDGEAAICGLRLASDLIARRKRARGPAAQRSRCFIWGGETTVTLGERQVTDSPLGGRSQELALAAARSLSDAAAHADGIALLAAGTDGRDGPTDAAGAIVDRWTWSAIEGAGRDPARDLATHDAYRALDAAGALIRSGPTGTNVMDVVIGLIW
jgi:hydroxypyruvate reductase